MTGPPSAADSGGLREKGDRLPLPRLFVVSAPSGAGKTTLCRVIRDRFMDVRYSISHTTRLPRPAEIEGVDYFFVSRQTFEKMIDDHQMAEWADVHGHLYGTSARFLQDALADGFHVILDIDVQGARQIRRRFPDCVTIFIAPPDMGTLRERLERRGADAPQTIEQRLTHAEIEMACADEYDHLVINDDLDRAISDLSDILKHHGLSETGERR